MKRDFVHWKKRTCIRVQQRDGEQRRETACDAEQQRFQPMPAFQDAKQTDHRQNRAAEDPDSSLLQFHIIHPIIICSIQYNR